MRYNSGQYTHRPSIYRLKYPQVVTCAVAHHQVDPLKISEPNHQRENSVIKKSKISLKQ
jgi:hypothetical protein